jgi:phospholipid/cholesterol/gamma-HCH transport system permease protein
MIAVGEMLHIEDLGTDGKLVRLAGRLDRESAPALMRAAGALAEGGRVRADLTDVTYLDDYGVLALEEMRDRVRGSGGRFELSGAGEKAAEILDLFHFNKEKKKRLAEKKKGPGILTELGEATIRHLADMRYQIAFIGSVLLALLYVLTHPKSLRTGDTVNAMKKTGVDAFPIVALISLLLGLIMAFMSSVQLRQFGANIYVASLVGLAMVRELGPIMTAIIVAGRSGSAFASEIATMKISEEVDALYTMGFDVTRFLVIPKAIAAVVTLPLLVIFADLFAILGGLLVGVLMLDLTASSYMTQTFNTIRFFDFWFGLFKGAFFAMVIAWVGCLRGFQARGGASAVGNAATSAVVSSIFLIILWDSVFAVILTYWG